KADEAKLLAVAQLADTDPFRKSLRQVVLDRDEKAMIALAREAKVENLPPTSVLLLVSALRGVGKETRAFGTFTTGKPQHPPVGRGREGELLALELLRRAQPHHAKDFWINLELGHTLFS